MLVGDFEAAWQESDSIAQRGSRGECELWDGKPFEGQRVYIRCLHGYGDAIQFLRYADPLRQLASSVAVQVHPEMVAVARRIRGIDTVVTWCNDLPREAWDQQIEASELPRAFRTSLATIPRDIPYVHVAESAIASSRRHLGTSSKPRVGLLWASSNWDPTRCMRLTDLQPLLHSKDIELYSFQRGPERSELLQLDSASRVHDTALHSPGIIDTAADLMNMDLLITVDTMAAHLAGALGRPVWTLLPYEADWRWMLCRSDSPWYPTMRLFRQKTPGDWAPVVAEVAACLNQGGAFARRGRRGS